MFPKTGERGADRTRHVVPVQEQISAYTHLLVEGLGTSPANSEQNRVQQERKKEYASHQKQQTSWFCNQSNGNLNLSDSGAKNEVNVCVINNLNGNFEMFRFFDFWLTLSDFNFYSVNILPSPEMESQRFLDLLNIDRFI